MAAITRRLSYVERAETKDDVQGSRFIPPDRTSRSEND
jgi:hypothetical protein